MAAAATHASADPDVAPEVSVVVYMFVLCFLFLGSCIRLFVFACLSTYSTQTYH